MLLDGVMQVFRWKFPIKIDSCWFYIWDLLLQSNSKSETKNIANLVDYMRITSLSWLIAKYN